MGSLLRGAAPGRGRRASVEYERARSCERRRLRERIALDQQGFRF